METSAISYRVADFLKKHPPFQAMEEADLLELAARGRVKFHEPNEYILWQGEPHRHQVFVIQQGTVSLWDEAAADAELRDVRGVGDMLGVEQFNGAQACVHSARSSSDVLIYAFPAYEFEALLDKYPKARQYVTAYGSVVTDYQWTDGIRDPRTTFLHDVVAANPLHTVGVEASIADVARTLLSTGAGAIAVVDSAGRARALVTPDSLMAWVATGGGDTGSPATALIGRSSTVAEAGQHSRRQPSVDGRIRCRGTGDYGRRHAGRSAPGGRDLAGLRRRCSAITRSFILRDIRHAGTPAALRALNQRARAFALQQLDQPPRRSIGSRSFSTWPTPRSSDGSFRTGGDDGCVLLVRRAARQAERSR